MQERLGYILYMCSGAKLWSSHVWWEFVRVWMSPVTGNPQSPIIARRASFAVRTRRKQIECNNLNIGILFCDARNICCTVPVAGNLRFSLNFNSKLQFVPVCSSAWALRSLAIILFCGYLRMVVLFRKDWKYRLSSLWISWKRALKLGTRPENKAGGQWRVN